MEVQAALEEDEAELRHPLLPQEPAVVAALGVEVSALRLQPRFARCCKTRRRRGRSKARVE
jgi:hypothetical protein